MPLESMHCTKLILREVRLPFRFAFGHATAVRRAAHILLIELQTSNHVIGYGEIILREYLTGETLEGAHNYIRDQLWPALRELHFVGSERPDEKLRPLYLMADGHGSTGAYAGLDVAVFDAWAKTFKIPGNRMLGGTVTHAARVTAPIGFGMPATMTVRALKALGFQDWKVKVGQTIQADIDRVATVRRIAGPEASIRIDANGIWTLDEAANVIQLMKAYNLACVEQPVAQAKREDLGTLATTASVPMMADESLCNLKDAAQLLPMGAKVQWNLRLAKVGGFTGVLTLAKLATDAGIPYQLGALVGETSLLTSALRACLGVLTPTYVECAFPSILLARDPFTATTSGGPSVLRPLTEAHGLGVSRRPLSPSATAQTTELT